MKNKIKVAMPLNIGKDDFEIFKSESYYFPPVLKVKKVKGPLVTYSGLVCTSKGVLKECYHHSMSKQVDICTLQASTYYQAAVADPNNLIILDDSEVYLLIHHPWFLNYYHWVCEMLTRIVAVKDTLSEMILLLPSDVPQYATESLLPFKFKSVFYIPVDKSVLVNNLCMPQFTPKMGAYNRATMSDLNQIYLQYANDNSHIDPKMGERIYLSRRKSVRRGILNEDEVIDALKKYNFKVVYNEDYSFFEQVAIYSRIKFLVSNHGAGLSNLLFMKCGSTVFELKGKQSELKNHPTLLYWYLASALDLNYYHQICDHDAVKQNDSVADFLSEHNADITVNIELFKRNLEKIFQKIR